LHLFIILTCSCLSCSPRGALEWITGLLLAELLDGRCRCPPASGRMLRRRRTRCGRSGPGPL